MDRTSVSLDATTRDRLQSLKRGQESYDEVLTCILNHVDRDASGEVVVE
ncbi:DUF7557 family protein [Halosegnis rubeus]|nr:hypothetical protein [Halosegnis rubeus]